MSRPRDAASGGAAGAACWKSSKIYSSLTPAAALPTRLRGCGPLRTNASGVPSDAARAPRPACPRAPRLPTRTGRRARGRERRRKRGRAGRAGACRAPGSARPSGRLPSLRFVESKCSCAYSGRGACEIEGRRDAARRGARAGGTHRHPRAQTPRRLGRRKRHASAERAAATPLEGAVRTPARMSLSDRSRCSRGELVAPAAATPSKPRMAPPWARVPSYRPHPRQIRGKILRGAVCVQMLPT